MTTKATYYPKFDYTPTDLSKYIEAAGIFTILLKSGKTVHFFPENNESFREWLNTHNIQNLRDN
ncbi:hypothetical protein GCM10027516_38700 [Niabella aquatica]